tara:strand:- start:547 stop:2259 length:1713 start_codon:yes stop_codon:yes gene_type:complete
MCGFVCIVRKNYTFSKSQINIPKHLLEHRGPDHTREIVQDNVVFRHWRLSIVDLTENSNQPVVQDGRIFVYNGEIYDYKTIGQRFNIKEDGDTRTIFSLLKKKNGFENIQNSSGFYSFLLHNISRNVIFGSRDRFGKKPLFYYYDSETAIFSSEERGILPFLDNKSINYSSLGEYLLYKSRFNGKSCFNNIYEIPPGSFFEFNIAKWKINFSNDWSNYYQSDIKNSFFTNDTNHNFDNHNNLESSLINAVEKRISCDVPVQIALSGGLDSATITSLSVASSFNENLLRTITVGFSLGIDESYEAKYLSENLNLNNRKVIFNNDLIFDYLKDCIIAMQAPLDHPHALAYYLLCNEVRKKGKVLITGEGADELFFGYDHYKSFSGNSFAFREFLSENDENFFITNNGNSLFSLLRENSNITNLRYESLVSPYKSRDMEIKTHLLSLLQRNDKMSMANSVEIRAPFLDPFIASIALNIISPDTNMENKSFIRKIFTRLNPKIKIKSQKNGFRVPIDENIEYIKNHKEGAYYIQLASKMIEQCFDFKVDNSRRLSPRLIWSLINIGCFLECYDN